MAISSKLLRRLISFASFSSSVLRGIHLENAISCLDGYGDNELDFLCLATIVMKNQLIYMTRNSSIQNTGKYDYVQTGICRITYASWHFLLNKLYWQQYNHCQIYAIGPRCIRRVHDENYFQ